MNNTKRKLNLMQILSKNCENFQKSDLCKDNNYVM